MRSSFDRGRTPAQPSQLSRLLDVTALALVSGLILKLASPQQGNAPTTIEAPAIDRSWWGLLKSLYAEINTDRVLAVAGGVTFFGLLALFPTITAIVSFYGLFNDRQQAAADLAMLATVMPPETMSVVTDQVNRIVSGDAVALGAAGLFALALSLWSSNSGMKSVMDALNVAYGVPESRSFIRLTLVSLGFTLCSILFFIAMIAVVAVIPGLLAFLRLDTWSEWLVWAGRWPTMILVLGLAISVLYRWGPALKNGRWRWISPGSILATLGLVLLSMLFSWYAASFGRFNETYGSLGAVIAFMTWLWLSVVVLLVGAELNAELDRRNAVPHTPQ